MPPRSVENGPLAVLCSPPITTEVIPLARFAHPPVTDELPPLAVFPVPPLTVESTPLAVFSVPPVIDENGLARTLPSPARMPAYELNAWRMPSTRLCDPVWAPLNSL